MEKECQQGDRTEVGWWNCGGESGWQGRSVETPKEECVMGSGDGWSEGFEKMVPEGGVG